VLQQRCPCGGTLLARYDLDGLSLDDVRRRPAGMWRYRELLPVQGDPVSLGEPETALLALPHLSERWGCEVFLKDDGGLAGGTFKARGAAAGLSRAAELGASGVVMPSAGNAGGAWSLYAARARMPITVTMARTAPRANQAEVRSAGGELVLVDGTIADAGRQAVEIARSRGAFLATTFSEPYRLEGKKSCWLEVFDRFGDGTAMRFPKTIVLPVGGGVAAVAAAKGAEEVAAAGLCGDDPPAVVGVQAAGCAPVVRAFRTGADEVEPWERAPETVAAGLRVPRPPEGALLLRSLRASGGAMIEVDDDAIISAISGLASSEGVFACPEGAAAVAATERLARAGRLEGPVVVYNTGAGAKYATDLAERL
jgi:threonine synthase